MALYVRRPRRDEVRIGSGLRARCAGSGFAFANAFEFMSELVPVNQFSNKQQQ